MDDIEKRARELLAAELGQYVFIMGRRSGVTFMRDAAMRAIAAALTPPEGYVLVPVEPTPGLLMSMAMRSDHALGCPGYYDQEMLRYPGAPTHQQRLDGAIREARAQYEEVVGAGFYSREKEADYATMLAARPEVK